jgi:hypothetical protein
VAPNVAAVKIGRADGIEIVASVGNGYWLSWWPGVAPAVRIQALDGAGVALAVLDRQGETWIDRGASQ